MRRRILVPVDGSPTARAGLEHALRTYPDDDVTVLHVMSPYHGWGGEDPPPPPDRLEAWHDTALERADEVFAEARRLADEHGATVSTALEVGEAWRAIVDYAAEHGVDHIVMGSHGRTADPDVALGSVAETVVRRSPVLVSVVR